MNILFYSILLIILALLLHLIIWRVHLPKKQTSALFTIFSLTIALGAFFLLEFPKSVNWNILSSKNSFELIQFFLLYISVAVAYIVSYPAIEVDSPTLIIIKAVYDAGPQGLEERKLEQMMSDNLLILPRIRDMVLDNMVYLKDGKYKLMLKGFVMARIFSFYRIIIGEEKGG